MEPFYWGKCLGFEHCDRVDMGNELFYYDTYQLTKRMRTLQEFNTLDRHGKAKRVFPNISLNHLSTNLR